MSPRAGAGVAEANERPFPRGRFPLRPASQIDESLRIDHISGVQGHIVERQSRLYRHSRSGIDIADSNTAENDLSEVDNGWFGRHFCKPDAKEFSRKAVKIKKARALQITNFSESNIVIAYLEFAGLPSRCITPDRESQTGAGNGLCKRVLDPERLFGFAIGNLDWR